MKDIRVGDLVGVIATGKVIAEQIDDIEGGSYFTVQFGEDRLFRGNFSNDQLCEVEDDTTVD